MAAIEAFLDLETSYEPDTYSEMEPSLESFADLEGV